MKKFIENSKKFSSAFFCVLLIAAMAIGCSSCSGKDKNGVQSTSPSSSQKSEAVSVGNGKTEFDFSVTDLNGNESHYKVKTDEKTVGNALLKAGLIEGDDAEYGLYVKSVDGIKADYDKDKTYWAFYIDGKYATAGVDKTEIKDGESYGFKIEK